MNLRAKGIASVNYVKSIVTGITYNMTQVRSTVNVINYRPYNKKAGTVFLGDEQK